jgi:serine/threonine protein kinase
MCSKLASPDSVLQFADRLLEHVDTLHVRHLVHRDMKPVSVSILGNLLY